MKAVCRKTLQEINHDSGAQSPAPKHSVKNYMSRKLRGNQRCVRRDGNALLGIAGCCCRRDKTELSHHADVIAGRVVIGDFAVSELQPVNMIGLEVFSRGRNAY
jgi:hypothetical protein